MNQNQVPQDNKVSPFRQIRRLSIMLTLAFGISTGLFLSQHEVEILPGAVILVFLGISVTFMVYSLGQKARWDEHEHENDE